MRIFLLGATPSFDAEQIRLTADRLAATGGNTGNQVIARGLLETIQYEAVGWDHTIGPRRVQSEFDVIVIPAANFLLPHLELGGMAAFIEKTSLPCAIVGLGAQSSDYDPRIELEPGTERFVRVVAERTSKIGVRGNFTAEVLNEMGIYNHEVTGCPSFYLVNGPRLDFRSRPEVGAPRFCVNGSRDVLGHSFDRERMRIILNDLIGEAIRHDADFVAQTELPEISVAERTPDADSQALPELVSLFANLAPEKTLRKWLTHRLRVFYDVDAWLEAMRTVDFVVGTRFHGCMMGVQAGASCFLLCHDTRTKEMAEFFGLPHCSINHIDRVDLFEMYEASDMTQAQDRYETLRPIFRRFLAANGLEPKDAGEDRQARPAPTETDPLPSN